MISALWEWGQWRGFRGEVKKRSVKNQLKGSRHFRRKKRAGGTASCENSEPLHECWKHRGRNRQGKVSMGFVCLLRALYLGLEAQGSKVQPWLPPVPFPTQGHPEQASSGEDLLK